jgi:hypothetical protein
LAKMFITAVILFIISQTITFASLYLTFVTRTTLAVLYPLGLFLTGFYTHGEIQFLQQMASESRQKTKTFYLQLRRLSA